MRIAVLKERAAGETRVAATPETIGKFIKLGATLAVESGAGEAASIADAAFAAAGAEVGPLAQVVADPERRKYLQNLPTSFALSDDAVDRLRETAAQLLRDSPAFRKLLEDLSRPR